MPSIISHPAIPLALAAALGPARVSTRLVAAGALAAILPDADVLMLQFGVPIGHIFGHRGFSHSIAFALGAGAVGAWLAPWLHVRRGVAFAFLVAAYLSHPLADMFTNGGRGVAILWPLSEGRVQAPWRPIEVSPIGVGRFLSERGLIVLASELRWLWMPAAVVASVGWWGRRTAKTPPT